MLLPLRDSFESNSSSGEEDDRSVQGEPSAKNGDGFHRGASGDKAADRPEKSSQPPGSAGSANFCERNQVNLERVAGVAMSEKAHSFSDTHSQEDKRIPNHQCSSKRSNVGNEDPSDSSVCGKVIISDNVKSSTQEEYLGSSNTKVTNTPPSFLRNDRQRKMSRENSSSSGFEGKMVLSADSRQLKDTSSLDVKAQELMQLPARDASDDSVASRTSFADHGTTVGSRSLDASASEMPCDSLGPIGRSSTNVTIGESDVREQHLPRNSSPKEPRPRIAQGLLKTVRLQFITGYFRQLVANQCFSML